MYDPSTTLDDIDNTLENIKSVLELTNDKLIELLDKPTRIGNTDPESQEI